MTEYEKMVLIALAEILRALNGNERVADDLERTSWRS